MNRLLVAALPVLLAAPALAQDQDARGGFRAANQTRTEAEQRAAAAFSMLDTNRDGVVSKDELDAAAKMTAANPRMAERITRMFAESDANHDGKLTAAEATARADQAFDAADADHDGVLTPEERQAARQKAAGQAPPQ
jgi:Ca2+-binding EF-hand superfamily protein